MPKPVSQLALLSALAAGLQGAPPCPLTVTVQGVESSVGVVGVLVFDSSEGWPEEFEAAFRRQAVEARPGEAELTFDDLPPGRYGIVALHDEDEDRKLDRNWLGIPKEGWGMSNNPAPRLSAPGFERAAFEHACAGRVEIRLRY